MPDVQKQFLTDFHAYRWGDVEVWVEKFKEGRDTFSVLATVLDFRGGGEPVVVMAPRRLNLHAPTTAATTAKLLAGRTNISQAEWGTRLETITYDSWQHYQEGDSRLLHADEIEVDYTVSPSLLHPLVAGNGVTLFYADSSAGKTMFAEAVGVSVVTGIPVLGLTPTVTGPVIYFDWEDNEETFRERVAAICAGAGIEVPHDFIYRKPDRSILAGEMRIRREVQEEQAVLGIFDSVGEMLGGDPSDPTLVIPAVNVMKRIGVPALGLHHISAEQAKSTSLKDKQKGYGSVYIRSGARLQWYLDRFQEEEADEGYLYAFNTKVNRGKKSKPLSWLVSYENADERLVRLQYSARSASDYFDRVKESTPDTDLSVKDAIAQFIRSRQGAAYGHDGILAGVTSLRGRETTIATIRTKVAELVREGVLVAVPGADGRPKYGMRSERTDDY